ncbi:retrotransposable element Tf2 [Tanacetum coccineum]
MNMAKPPHGIRSSLEVPIDAGVRQWLQYIASYVNMLKGGEGSSSFSRMIHDDDKVKIVSIHLQDKALTWHLWFVKTYGETVSWNVYEEAIMKRFGSVNEDPMEELKNLSYETSMKEYQTSLKSCLFRYADIPESQSISMLIAGLPATIVLNVRMFKPKYLADAFSLASLQKATLVVIKQMNTPLLPNAKYQSGWNANKNVTYPTKSTTITLALPDPNTLNYEQEQELPQHIPHISRNALSGVPTHNTMRLKGHVLKQILRILMESSNTHNLIFLDLYTAKKLGYAMLLPLGGSELVLRIQLSTLGTIQWNFELMMQFHYEGKKVVLRGTNQSKLAWSTNAVMIRRVWLIQTYNAMPKELPSHRSFDHKIPLKEGNVSVNVRPYRYPPAQKDAIVTMVKELLDLGATMCDNDVYKTAFKSHEEHYEFVVMSIGLTNAPSTFQALMNFVFKPFLRKFTLVFFDDILYKKGVDNAAAADALSIIERQGVLFCFLAGKSNELMDVVLKRKDKWAVGQDMELRRKLLDHFHNYYWWILWGAGNYQETCYLLEENGQGMGQKLYSLPLSHGKSVLLVVVDRLSKYAHFLPITHPYTALQMAQLFLDNVYKLHGLPKTIVSDKDKICMSLLWQSLLKMLQVKFKMSIAYHPQTYGQTKIVNKCLETYLRCLTVKKPKEWVKWISLEEYWHNTNFHTAINTTRFEDTDGDVDAKASQLFRPSYIWKSCVRDLQFSRNYKAKLDFEIQFLGYADGVKGSFATEESLSAPGDLKKKSVRKIVGKSVMAKKPYSLWKQRDCESYDGPLEYDQATDKSKGLEQELWTLTLKGDDIEALLQKIVSSTCASLCHDLVPSTEKKKT